MDVKIIYLTRILFNFSGGIKLNFELSYYMLNPSITHSACINIFIYRTSLIICLFYKVKVICDKTDKLYP